MSSHTFVGFGFGPIQSGLFVAEAFKSGNFKRLVIAEIDESLVQAVRDSGGSYYINVACEDCIRTEKIEGLEILNPKVDADRKMIVEAIAEATEIATSLPSVNFYDSPGGVAQTIAEGLSLSKSTKKIIYTAENNNHAASILSQAVSKYQKTDPDNVQFLDTVIGKMSQVTTDNKLIEKMGLKTITDELQKAFLVEQFNRILVTRCTLANFTPGIEVFAEKDDLLPFEEAKLYGHNAIHALLAYLGLEKGYKTMNQLADDDELMNTAKAAFIDESGAALIKKHKSLGDNLFTPKGYKDYALDLLARMTNPHLCDSVERAARDPQRKLGYNDRLFGTMHICLEQEVKPVNMAKGAAAAIRLMPQSKTDSAAAILKEIWDGLPDQYAQTLIDMVS